MIGFLLGLAVLVAATALLGGWSLFHCPHTHAYRDRADADGEDGLIHVHCCDCLKDLGPLLQRDDRVRVTPKFVGYDRGLQKRAWDRQRAIRLRRRLHATTVIDAADIETRTGS
jgi:hypothetical protein